MGKVQAYHQKKGSKAKKYEKWQQPLTSHTEITMINPSCVPPCVDIELFGGHRSHHTNTSAYVFDNNDTFTWWPFKRRSCQGGSRNICMEAITIVLKMVSLMMNAPPPFQQAFSAGIRLLAKDTISHILTFLCPDLMCLFLSAVAAKSGAYYQKKVDLFLKTQSPVSFRSGCASNVIYTLDHQLS